MVSVIFLAAIFENNDDKFLYMYLVIMIIYAICFYKTAMSNRLETFASHSNKYDFIEESKKYLRKDGKVLVIIYSVCAFACELSYFIITYTSIPEEQNIIATACLMFFPFIDVVEIPILRSVLNLILAILIAVITTNIKSYLIYKELKKVD